MGDILLEQCFFCQKNMSDKLSGQRVIVAFLANWIKMPLTLLKCYSRFMEKVQ
jgi:hypothetical protein